MNDNPKDPFLTITLEGKEDLVTITCDGTIIYGRDYTPDLAAQTFWEALSKHRHLYNL